MSEMRPEEPGYGLPPKSPPAARRQRLNPAFVAIGVLTNISAYVLSAGLGAGGYSSALYPLAGLLVPISVTASIITLVAGIITRRARLLSFGIGGIAVQGVVLLGLLLLFGTCLMAVGSGSS